MDALVTQAKARDDRVHKDDSVEVFLDVRGRRGRRSHVQLIVNAAGVVADTKNGNAAWNPSHQVAASRQANAWTLELAVPWSGLDLPSPRAGASIVMNVCRTRRTVTPAEYSLWAPTLSRYAEGDLFGTVKLGQ